MPFLAISSYLSQLGLFNPSNCNYPNSSNPSLPIPTVVQHSASVLLPSGILQQLAAQQSTTAARHLSVPVPVELQQQIIRVRSLILLHCYNYLFKLHMLHCYNYLFKLHKHNMIRRTINTSPKLISQSSCGCRNGTFICP